MAWMDEVRERARARLEQARQGVGAPPFPGDVLAGRAATPVVMVDSSRRDDDGLPNGIRVAGAWCWRIILFFAVGWVLIRVFSRLDVVLIPVIVAVLLAALFQPAAAWLRRRGMGRTLASTVVEVGALIIVLGGLSLIVNTVVGQVDTLSSQVGDGVREVQDWLVSGPLHLSRDEISNAIAQAQKSITANRGALTSGAVTTAATVGEVGAGFFLTLFSLFFFLRDGDNIWRFLCRLLPQSARVPVARAGHYSWHTLTAYVHATVLVAFVDAIGIGIGLIALRVPLALPLAALVFLGAFIPVVGATLSGAVACLVALVTVGPVRALILLGVVIAVQQLEGHVLQPLIMGRAVALHPLAIVLAIASGIILAGIVGGLIAVPLLAVLNTAVRYLSAHPQGEPTPDRESPGTTPADDDESTASAPPPGPDSPPPASSSLAKPA